MSTLVMWFFGAWVAVFVGAALILVGFDAWLTYRRDLVRQDREERL